MANEKTKNKKNSTPKKTTKKVAPKKSCSNAYFWGGLAIALCAAGAFMVLAFGIGSVIR